MGDDRWKTKDWDKYDKQYKVTAATSANDIFTSKFMDKALDPYEIKVRESCDSKSNPRSTALIVGYDTTGSMDPVLQGLAQHGIKKLVEEIYTRQPISDPHVLVAGINDVAAGSRAPLQVTQFEANIKILEQTQKIWLEYRGGGNGSESYELAWYFAAYHTRIDCFEKRKEKGVLFTIGDDGPTPFITKEQIERVFGDKPEFDKITSEQMLTIVSRMYNVFHISLAEGTTYEYEGTRVDASWKKLLGERYIVLKDYNYISETIVSILQMLYGTDYKSVVNSWDNSTNLVVADALKNSNKGMVNTEQNGVVLF